MASDYELQWKEAPDGASAGKRRRVVPPVPKPGQRMPRPYSTDDLDSLYATARSLPFKWIASIHPPPSFRIHNWPLLRRILKNAKALLHNLHRRKGFPVLLFTTEFDPAEIDGANIDCASFHLYGCKKLMPGQVDFLRDWSLELFSLADNQGGCFHYKSGRGGRKLHEYAAKDVDWRTPDKPRMVKYPVAWLPKHTDCRLWFAVGAGKHKSAEEGRKLWKVQHKRRKRFDNEHGFSVLTKGQKEKGKADNEHGIASITAVSLVVPVESGETVVAEDQSKLAGPLDELRALSPLPLCGENMKQCYGLSRALENHLLSLRLDLGGMDIAKAMHATGKLSLVCAPPSGGILHMLVSDGADLPSRLRVQLQPGTAVPRDFEVIYLAA